MQFFPSSVVSILLYGCTTWTLIKRIEKKLDGYYARMLRAILNKSKKQHPTKQQLCGYQTPMSKTIKIRRTWHARQCISKDETITDVLLWTPSHGRASVGQPAKTYLQQLCTDTGCSQENQPKAMYDRDQCRERERERERESEKSILARHDDEDNEDVLWFRRKITFNKIDR